MSDLPALKKKIRNHFLARRNKIPAHVRNKFSDATCLQLKELADNLNIATVHAFIPFQSEIDLTPFLHFCLQQKITVITPRIRQKPEMHHLVTTSLHDLKKNKMGISETTSNEIYSGQYDLILVPGVVFDSLGYRIGYGGGYYDYFLSKHPGVLKAGVGFPLQYSKVPLPREDHDIPVDLLVLGPHLWEMKKSKGI